MIILFVINFKILILSKIKELAIFKDSIFVNIERSPNSFDSYLLHDLFRYSIL